MFGKKLDISRAKTDREAIKIMADYIRYLQEVIEKRDKEIRKEMR